MINDRQIGRLFWAAKAGLIVLLLYAIVGAVIVPFRLDAARRPRAAAGEEPVRLPVATTRDEGSPADYSAIVNNDLFRAGGATGDSVMPASVDTMRSAEELGLKLVGVIAAGPVASRAVIESSQDKSAQPYKIGDTVASAKIESIEPDNVVMLYGGERRVLVLRTATMTESSADPARSDGSQPVATGPVTTAKEVVALTSSRLSYVEDVFRKATMEPQTQDGQAGGLKITGLDQTPLAGVFGLRNGDVIRTVNGQDLSSKQKAFQVLKKARTQSKLDIELLRGGKTKNLSFDL